MLRFKNSVEGKQTWGFKIVLLFVSSVKSLLCTEFYFFYYHISDVKDGNTLVSQVELDNLWTLEPVLSFIREFQLTGTHRRNLKNDSWNLDHWLTIICLSHVPTLTLYPTFTARDVLWSLQEVL